MMAFKRSSEHLEQTCFIEWLATLFSQYPELRLGYAIINGAKLPYSRNKKGERYSREANKLMAEGLTPGIPDWCLPCPRGPYHGLYIELKHGNNKPSPHQRAILQGLADQGYKVVVAWEFEGAQLALLDYLMLEAAGKIEGVVEEER
jgi:hypothetical protein